MAPGIGPATLARIAADGTELESNEATT